MVLLFTATGYIALGVFLLAVWHVWSQSAGGSLLIEYGQAISSKYGSKARKMAAIAFLLSGVALCIMLLSLAFVRGLISLPVPSRFLHSLSSAGLESSGWCYFWFLGLAGGEIERNINNRG